MTEDIFRRNLTDTLSVRSWKSYDNGSIYYKSSRKSGYSIYLRSEKINVLLLDYTVKVKPNTCYIVSADCKTKDVADIEGEFSMGANISVGNYNNSKGISGTSDWQTIRVIGRSDGNGNLTITLGLGYWNHAGVGEAWFENISYIPAEEFALEDRTWRLLGIVLANTAFKKKDGSLSVHKMGSDEINAARTLMMNAAEDMTSDSQGLLRAEMDVIVSYGLYDSYTYTEAFEYSMSHTSAYEYCKKNNIDISEYDHVTFLMCQPDMPHKYFGLGGCFMHRYIGHSSILYHLPQPLIDSTKPEALWPEGIYVHEFLHAAESYSNVMGLEHATLHGGKDYGYSDKDGWRKYYSDFMQNKISHNGKNIGINPIVWRIPPHIFN